MKTILKSLFLLLVISFFSSEIIAQTKLSVQGVIRLSDGNAVDDGFYSVTFKLYDTLTTGNLLWTEIQPQVKVTSGIYSTILGEVTPLDLTFDEFYFLSLTIDGEELTPRAPLTSAPYANSMLGFDNVFPSTGNVGIGTLTPTNELTVEGDIEVNGNIGIGTDNATSPLDVVGNIEVSGSRLHVNTNGRVAIGNSNPQSKLDIIDGDIYIRSNGSYRGGIRFLSNNNGYLDRKASIESVSVNNGSDVGDLRFYTCYGVAALRMIIEAEGNVGIGESNPSHILHIGGQGRSTNSAWATSSDGRVKQKIKTITGSLDKILQLRPVNYQWITEYKNANKGLKTKNTGFISQEVEKIFPEMVTIAKESFGAETIEDFRVLNISDLPVHLVKAMQEQQGQIEKLKVENEKLRSTLSAQSEASNARMSVLEAKLNQVLEQQSVSKL
jgi:hypothetical protein